MLDLNLFRIALPTLPFSTASPPAYVPKLPHAPGAGKRFKERGPNDLSSGVGNYHPDLTPIIL
jgi:hypothetical protein